MKKGIIPFLLLLLFTVVTGCSSKEADAGEALEAAGVEWTEDELSKVDGQVFDLDARTKELQNEVNALLGKPPGTTDPGDGNGQPEPSVPPASGSVFLDVKPDYWAFTEIMKMYDQKIISGYTDIQKFLPENSITRAQAASMLVKALKLPLSDTPSSFSDVKNGDWSRRAIMTVVEKGYFKGSGNKFMPNDPMKRKHMAVVLQRSFELEPTSDPYEGYKDVPKSDDGYLYIQAVSQHGVAKGSEGYFKPYEPTKRSQFSVFLYRALK
ncbi:S-layer homology domain-containing protein [Cytobacillus massiliigabonensis]|uniref:S-layer homology domain-containing protein n=1 Tax=Cytobacillus massiliigabonensis TaxID=1871011 RepID=UPI000C8253BF|nr:S-layer homology domain-containing protein [Cytobacillus massiliigabonensis]